MKIYCENCKNYTRLAKTGEWVLCSKCRNCLIFDYQEFLKMLQAIASTITYFFNIKK